MQLRNLTFAALACATAGVAAAQNDECATATVLPANVATPFDTTVATLSPEAWPCASSSSPDVWFTYTAPAGGVQATVSLCGGATYDTALQIFSGTCANLTSIACNDDSCGLQSQISFAAAANTTYFVRIGGFGAAASGAGTVTVTEAAPPPPPPSNCVQTITPFNGANGGSVGGCVYFTMTLTQQVTFSGLETNYDVAAGSPVGIEMWTTPGTHAGNEANPAVWTQVGVDNGQALAQGFNVPTPINFAAPVTLAAGSYGIALVSVGDGHRYTNGNGTNQNFVSPDGVIALSLGTATNLPFAGTPFSPRVWNGRLCSSGPVTPGTNYCGPAVANSTGASGEMSASGSADVAANNLVLEASSLPLNAFGFFLTSRTQGTVNQPGGSQGVLCLGGQIGRYVGPGQIRNSGATGAFNLGVNLTQTPTPSGLVSVAAGETWNFQAWYRDAVGGSATSNFTDGLSVTFQ